jgi:hypothetical protein
LSGYSENVSKVMMTVKLGPDEVSLAAIREKLGVKPDEIDPSFGVVSIDPDQNLYAVMIEEDSAADLAQQDGVEGPFSNPGIETFGPVQRGPSASQQ